MAKSHAGSGWASEPPTPAQMKEFWSQVDSGKVTKERFQTFLRGGAVVQDWIGEWQRFYKKYFGMKLDFSNIQIPEHQSGFDRLIIVAKGITLNQTYKACAKHFPCRRYVDDLDKAVTHNDRTAEKGSYAVWFRDRKEADEELKNLSANKLTEKEIPGITLLERLLYELKYWEETDEHLDVSNWTLCSGSRDSDGSVPKVGWCGDGLGVDWYYSNNHYVYLRSRAAVS